MGGTFPRVKVWSGNEDVTAADLNAEFDNILTNQTPQGADDYSTNATQMRVQTNPGAVGTESLATSTAGELERLRFVLARILGSTYWYDAPALSLADADSLISQGGSIPKSRVTSGKVRTSSAQPIFLQPDGTAATVTLKASVGVPFKYVINDVEYSLTADVAFTGLSLAPSTNNTALVNDAALAGANDTKYVGEEDADQPTLTIDTVGSEISSLLDKFAAFKIGTEAFFGYVSSATTISKAFRGYFFDSSDAPVVRVVVSNNDTITLLRLTWVFAKADGTLTVSYTNPRVAFDQPTAPGTGDYWFDLSVGLWKRFDGAAFVDATATLIGICAQDTTGCKYARSIDPFAFYSDRNTIELERIDGNTLRSVSPNSEVSVYGQRVVFGPDLQEFEMPGDLASGESETSSTTYYAYVTESGDTILSSERPYKRTHDLLGFYHPYQSWRAIGRVFEDSGSAFDASIPILNYRHNASIRSQGVTQEMLAPRISTSSVAGVGGVAISASSGNTTSASGTFAAISQLSVTLTTSGRPVYVGLVSDPAQPGILGPEVNGGSGTIDTRSGDIRILRNGSVTVAISTLTVGYVTAASFIVNSGQLSVPVSSLNALDTPTAGTHTYTVEVRINTASSVMRVAYAKLIAYEI